MDALGSDDGREIVLQLDELHEEGVLTRGPNWQWELTKDGRLSNLRSRAGARPIRTGASGSRDGSPTRTCAWTWAIVAPVKLRCRPNAEAVVIQVEPLAEQPQRGPEVRQCLVIQVVTSLTCWRGTTSRCSRVPLYGNALASPPSARFLSSASCPGGRARAARPGRTGRSRPPQAAHLRQLLIGPVTLARVQLKPGSALSRSARSSRSPQGYHGSDLARPGSPARGPGCLRYGSATVGSLSWYLGAYACPVRLPSARAAAAPVRKPVQYVGGEVNSTVKAWDETDVRWALFYPTRTRSACLTRASRSSTRC